MRASRLEFIREQGYPAAGPDDELFSALMLQPRIIGGLTVLGVLLQSPWLFIGLSAALWWGALVSTRNPFDTIYNVLVARRRGLARLSAAPAPRRFAMTMAATVSLVIGVALVAEVSTVAWLFEGLFVIAVAAVVFANRCAGATLYDVLRRRLSTWRPSGGAAAQEGRS